MIIATTNPNEDNFEFFDESSEQNLSVQEYLQEIQVLPKQHGCRLDHFLVAMLDGFSRHYLQQLIIDNAVILHGTGIVCKPSTKVRLGQQWQVQIRPTAQSKAFIAQSIEIDVIYQDGDVIVLNKPSGLVVHPAPGNWSGTLLNALLWHYPELSQLPRAGIVHRLDKDTSGLMVVAKHRKAMDGLTKMIAQRQISRQYLAVSHGGWKLPRQIVVDKAIGRDPRNRVKMAVVDISRNSGKTAKSTFKLLKSTDELSLVHCTLDTGRTHQIRVHMKHLGFSLVADTLYGGKVNQLIDRQALHAWRLAFKQPITDEMLCFYAPIPQDMVKLLKFLEFSEQNILNALECS